MNLRYKNICHIASPKYNYVRSVKQPNLHFLQDEHDYYYFSNILQFYKYTNYTLEWHISEPYVQSIRIKYKAPRHFQARKLMGHSGYNEGNMQAQKSPATSPNTQKELKLADLSALEFNETVPVCGLEDLIQFKWFFGGLNQNNTGLPIWVRVRGTRNEDHFRAYEKLRNSYLSKEPGFTSFWDREIGRFAIRTNLTRIFCWKKGEDLLVLCPTTEALEIFYEEFKDVLFVKGQDTDVSEITEVIFSEGRISTRQQEIEHSKVHKIYPELYPSIDIDKLIDDYMSSPESILILTGEPGVGKTCLIKWCILHDRMQKILYVKDENILKSAEFFSIVTKMDPDVVILDDVDSYLAADRSTDKRGNFINYLLSSSDGIFPIRTKYIISTNKEIREIDPAITRPGRCFDFIELEALTKDEALAFWISLGLTKDDFDSRNFDNHVTQATLMSEVTRLQKNVIVREYVKRGSKSYSVAEKLKNMRVRTSKEKLGFHG